MNTIGRRTMSEKEQLFVEMCMMFYDKGLSVNEMIQGCYEAQLHWKRDRNKPVSINLTEKVS